ncbi:transcription repressor OFP8 [Beta vulgaris subsp. vulgaris]|uniref:transcription repressor OFP8 n=1 Tax=Beta vulgaris subsp. vulgaris TaxID=3555 RepID=UPI002036A070|nr:transcription repressor OFP8 [Beta vulgaris subsp. vulgaris]
MEKENKFKLKLPRIFTSSCKTQNISEVIDHKNPIFTPQNTIFLHTPLMEVSQLQEEEEDPNYSPVIKFKQIPSSSSSSMMYCKPRCPETFDQMVRENCIITGNPFPRRKIAGKYSLLSPAGEYSGGRRCPPASPATPLFSQKKKKKKKKKRVNNKNENTHLKNLMKNEYPNKFNHYSSSNETDIGDWFSSDDEREEDETETLFSLKSMSFSSKSISLSSDSDRPKSVRTRTRPRSRTRRPKPGSRFKRENVGVEEEEEVGMVPLQGKVKDTFAVVKSSSDPYNDFRTSMVEMIIEKQIFGTKELEELLQCFLSLNSPHHHRVIVDVFTEIWDALFSYCS